MNPLISENLSAKIETAGIIAVLVVDKPESAIPLAKTLYNNGIEAMELTLRTDAAMESLKLIIDEVPGMLAGVGTILDPQQVREAKESGSAFGVAPGYNQIVVDKAVEEGLPFAPGISIPSEIERAVESGCSILKYFHAEGMGGIKYLKGINSPYGFLNLRYIPLGGLTIYNIIPYLEAPEVLALGGSWIAPRKLIQAEDWDTIARNAEEAVKILKEVRG